MGWDISLPDADALGTWMNTSSGDVGDALSSVSDAIDAVSTTWATSSRARQPMR